MGQELEGEGSLGGRPARNRGTHQEAIVAMAKTIVVRDAARSGFNSVNYELTPADPAEGGLVKLFARPKRRDVNLIDGAVFVTDTDADLVRVEGRLAKNPSFWAKRVDVVKHYGRIGGLRVPVRLDSTAQMRLAGTSTLTMTYDYEMINGIAVTPSHAIAALGQ